MIILHLAIYLSLSSENLGGSFLDAFHLGIYRPLCFDGWTSLLYLAK